MEDLIVFIGSIVVLNIIIWLMDKIIDKLSEKVKSDE